MNIRRFIEPGAIVPIDAVTTAELVRELARLCAALEEIVQKGGQDLCRGIAAEALRGAALGEGGK